MRATARTIRVSSKLQIAGDMRDFDLGRQFALVTMPFRAFQHLLTVEDQIACLTCIRHHISAVGRFIVDLFNPSLEMLVTQKLGWSSIATRPSCCLMVELSNVE